VDPAGGAGRRFEDGARGAARADAARRDRAVGADRVASLVEERDVDREAHAEGVDRAAAREVQSDSGRGLSEEGESEQARASRARREDRQAGAARFDFEVAQASRRHIGLSRRRGWVRP
jgi:hypothetical protein